MVEERTLVAVTLHVCEECVVDPPCVVEFLEFCVIDMLLPVKPPEVYAFFLHRMHHVLEHVAHELLVRVDPFDAFLALRVFSKTLSEGRVALLPVVKSIRGVEVQGHLQSFSLEILHELFRVRE